MLCIENVKTNLIPFDAAEVSEGMDLHHESCGPAFLIGWKPAKHDEVAGEYSRLPYIQLLDDNGEPYTHRERPDWFVKYMPVNPADLYMEAV